MSTAMKSVLDVIASSEFITATLTVIASYVFKKYKDNKTLKKIVPIVNTIFDVVEEIAPKIGISKNAKWLKFLQIADDILDENFTPKEIAMAKKQVDNLAKLQKLNPEKFREVVVSNDSVRRQELIEGALKKYHNGEV